MEILRCADLIDVPWKNGGGTTRNIAMGLTDAQTAWRLSRADVAQDGPFSNFAGLERILTVVTGGGMALEHPGGTLHARPWQPVRFDGGLEVFSRLQDGPLTDFNLMFDPTLCDGTVTPHLGPLKRPLTPLLSGITAFHVLAGRPMIGSEGLAIGDTAFLDAPAILALADGDAILEIVIQNRDQSDAIRLCIAER